MRLPAEDGDAHAPAERGYRQALRSGELRLLLAAFLTDEGASRSYSVVLVVYAYDRTGSTGWITAVAASRWVTGIVVSGHAGVLADRCDRWALLIASAARSR